MSYKVMNEFIEKHHDSHHYKKDDIYPKDGYEADPERVAFLQQDTNQYKKVFLSEKQEEKQKKKAKVDAKSDNSNQKGSSTVTSTSKETKRGKKAAGKDK